MDLSGLRCLFVTSHKLLDIPLYFNLEYKGKTGTGQGTFVSFESKLYLRENLEAISLQLFMVPWHHMYP